MALASARAVSCAQRHLLRTMSTKSPAPAKDIGSVESEDGITILYPAQAFKGDTRSVSGLGMGDGINTHTGKWLVVGAEIEFVCFGKLCGVVPIVLCPLRRDWATVSL